MGRSINYRRAISETAEALLRLEKQQSHSILRDRVRFLRLLKEGSSTTQAEAAQAVGLAVRQGQRNWKRYTQGGVNALLAPIALGKRCRLRPEQQEAIKDYLKAGEIQTLAEAADLIQREFGISYSQPGVYYLFQQLKIKKKTGRPLNVRQQEHERADFKKNTTS